MAKTISPIVLEERILKRLETSRMPFFWTDIWDKKTVQRTGWNLPIYGVKLYLALKYLVAEGKVVAYHEWKGNDEADIAFIASCQWEDDFDLPLCSI